MSYFPVYTKQFDGFLLFFLLLFFFFHFKIGRFDVQLDMIIRTEESRKLGARFLDNADVGSREECVRLCCETDDCDVFIFEEKVSVLHAFLPNSIENFEEHFAPVGVKGKQFLFSSLKISKYVKS